jgi:hypothetical protein
MTQKKVARRSRARKEVELLPEALRLLRSDVDELVKRISGHLEASQQEARHLAKRVQELERLVKQSVQAKTPAVSMQTPSWPSKSLFTFLGRANFPVARPTS